MIGLLLRFIPFAGPIGVLIGLIPRLLHLKREKAIHREAGEPFAPAYQSEIDSHTIRLQTNGWRLGCGVMTAFAVVNGIQWASNDRYKDNYKIERDIAERNYLVANNAARAYRTHYEIARNDLNAMRAQVSEASLRREAQIATKTKAKVERVKRAAALPPTSTVDAADWLRVESLPRSSGDGADSVPAAPAS